MSKKLHKYAETLYHLINFRLSQFIQSRSMLKMDYDTFMIVSCIGAHALKANIKNKMTGSQFGKLQEQKILINFIIKKN